MRIPNTHQGKPCKKGHDGLRYASGHCVECKKVRVKKYREENRDAYLNTRKNFREKNREKLNQEGIAYYKTETGLLNARLNSSKRRAMKRTGKVTRQEIQNLFQNQKGLCVVCKEKLNNYHVDHIQPLSRGGEHNIFNLQLLCQTCNQVKFNKDPIDFMQSKGYLL